MAAPLRRQSLRRRGTPAGRPQPQRPPPPVQPKLAVAGPAELVTCDQTIERRIPYTKLGRHVRIATSDLDAFITAGRIEAGTLPGGH
jgi:hypothetical protein